MIATAVHGSIFEAVQRAITDLSGGFNPRTLFADGSIGVLYDNNDLTSFYLDAAGTTPATVNGLVGLQLDKSQGLALGAEIRSSGAVGLVGTATAATYNTSTGVGTATRVDASNQSFVNWTGLATGSWYLLTIQNTGTNALSIRSGAQAGTPWLTLLASESKTLYVPESTGLVTITSSSGTASFTLSTIKQALGNHRYQSTTGSKPILRGTPTGAELFTAYGTPGAGWSVAGATGTATTASSALPTATAAVVGKHYRVTYTVTRSAGSVQLSFGGRTGVSRSAAGQYVEYFDNALNTNALTATGTGFTGTVRIDEVKDVSAGSVTAPYGLQYDGVDDFLQTASVNFSATDKMFVCAGVRKLSDAFRGMLAELTTSSVNNGSFSLDAPPVDGATSYRVGARGTAGVEATAAGYAAQNTHVLQASINLAGASSATQVTSRINGSAVSLSYAGTTGSTGSFANAALYFGRRAGTSLPYNGLDFGFVIVGKTLTSAQISSTERYIAQRTGVSI